MIKTVVVLLMAVCPGSAATYYVSSGIGSDSNTSTQAKVKTTPWAHAPGMANCTSACASYTPLAGDQFILRGGDTWNNDSFEWTITWSGSSGSPIYFGVDQTWYTGSSWTRPLFDMQSTAAGANNIVINLNGNSYVTVDNVEVINFRWTGAPAYGTTIGVRLNGTYFTLNNLYFHAWTHDNPGAACTPSVVCDAFHVMNGSTSLSGNTGTVIDNLTCDGSPSGTDSGMCTYAVPTVINSTARNMSNGFLMTGTTVTFSDSTVGPIVQSYDPNNHQNCFEPTGEVTVYMHDNVLHDCIAVTALLGSGNGIPTPETDWVWNNVIYNSPAIPMDIDTIVTGGTAHIWNNTLVATTAGACIGQAIRGGNALALMDAENNHCISDNSDASEALLCQGTWAPASCSTAATTTLTTNASMSHATATGQGFTTGNRYAETSASNSTYQAGTNLTSSCSGALASLCTGYNGAVRDPVKAWDASAYQFVPAVQKGIAAVGLGSSGILKPDMPRPRIPVWEMGPVDYAPLTPKSVQ